MAWYWIVLIVLAALLGLLFLVYMTNADMKLIEKIYNSLIKNGPSYFLMNIKEFNYDKEKYNIFKYIFSINNITRNRSILFYVEYKCITRY